MFDAYFYARVVTGSVQSALESIKIVCTRAVSWKHACCLLLNRQKMNLRRNNCANLFFTALVLCGKLCKHTHT